MRFVHAASCTVAPSQGSPALSVQRTPSGTQAVLPARPEFDTTRWQITEAHREVKLAVGVERIWWGLASETELGAEISWTDQPISLTRERLLATSDSVLHVRLPGADWTASLGFDLRVALPLQGPKGDAHRSLPLRNFGDHRALETPTGRTAVKLFVEAPGLRQRSVATIGWVALPEPSQARTRPLDIAALCSARTASALTRLARSLRGRERRVVLKFRKQHYTRPGKDDTGRQSFVRISLCMLHALGKHAPQGGLTERWRRRARAASDEFPEAMMEVERFLAQERRGWVP